MNWTWDDDKNRANIQKHGISFETAILALQDELAVTEDDPYPHEQRFQTTGMVGVAVLIVIHTFPENNPEFGGEVGRVISARRATSRERRKYESESYRIDS